MVILNELLTNETTQNILKSFVSKGTTFMKRTEEHVNQGCNPGGIYQAIWCRDASYILGDWFASGNTDGTLLQIYQIWSHQITPNREKIVYGRGSPNTKFSAAVADSNKEMEFEGSLPTTIYQTGFSEVYGLNPDIDSTALILSTTSWILANWYVLHETNLDNKYSSSSSSESATVASEQSSDYVTALLGKIGATDPIKVTEFVVPRMLKAVEYLSKRDTDNDGLLEQEHNEDWMDTAIRTGKIVYSQACWIWALENFSLLLSKIGKNSEASKITELANKATNAVDQKLWSDEDGCYLDLHETRYNGQQYRILTEDVSLFLIAITQNTEKNSMRILSRRKGLAKENEPIRTLNDRLQKRALSTLEAIKNRCWKDKWPLITEAELKASAPWHLKPYEYHNHTFWPWVAGMEMFARSRFGQVEECDMLLSKLASDGKPHIYSFYEWLNPITSEGHGAFPFRTGIVTVREAIAGILIRIKDKFPQAFDDVV